ncbi:MAG: hypothetical protein WC450_07355 [Candidatus Omnitrophota bacterium]|jgi:hypothetical protein
MENAPAVQLTPSSAVSNIETKFPREAAFLKAMIKKDIVTLGTDSAFALRDGDGEIRCYKQNLTLTAKEGTLIQPVPGGPYVISAMGYEQWSSAAGACVIFPSEVLVDGEWKQNPYVQRDPQNRRILCIYARAIAFRFSDKGLPQVSDWSTIFDTPSYRMIDLLAKAKQLPQAFRLLPEGMEPKDPGTWAKYPFDESTCLWVNTAHNEALSWFSQILNREKKAIDFAQTFAKRNALKHLSGLQKAQGPELNLSVLCWRPMSSNSIIKWDSTMYANLQQKVGKIVSGDRSEFKQIDVASGAERTSETLEETEGLIEQSDPEDQGHQVIDMAKQEPEVVAAPEPEKPKEPTTEKAKAKIEKVKAETRTEEKKAEPSAEEAKIMKNLKVMSGQFPAEFAECCKSLNIDAEKYTSKDSARIIQGMNQLLA